MLGGFPTKFSVTLRHLVGNIEIEHGVLALFFVFGRTGVGYGHVSEFGGI